MSNKIDVVFVNGRILPKFITTIYNNKILIVKNWYMKAGYIVLQFIGTDKEYFSFDCIAL